MVEVTDAAASQEQQQQVEEGRTYLNVGGCHTTEQGGSDSCGYCKGKDKQPKGYKSWGITSTKMPVGDYQKLMDRGWRRCGQYYYKWDFLQACC